MIKCSCSGQWGLVLNHFANDKNVPKLQRKNDLQGERRHNTDIWTILTVKFDTVCKELNYLPNTLIPFFYFPQHEVPFTFMTCIYFLSYEPYSVWKTVKKCNKTLSKKITRALSCWWNFCSHWIWHFFKIHFFCPWWFSAITIYLLSNSQTKST